MNQMTSRWFHLGLALVLSAGAATALGCTSPTDSGSEQELGTVRLPLVSPTHGTYRLHNATFGIATQSGTPVVTLDSESDPDAEAVSATLTQGAYSVRLQDGWELDSIAADGTETPVQAALISHNPQTFEIRPSTDTDLTFTFTTGDGTVVIGEGSVNISVDVASNEGLASCDVMNIYSCPSGQTCLLADASGRTFCATAGSLPVGSPCSADQCVAGAQCLKVDPSNPDQGVCTQFCNTNASLFGCNCVSLFLDNNSSAGICGPTPAGTCDLLTQTGCEDGQACQYLGGGFGTCGVPGTTPPHEACSGETCTAGFQCYGGTCRQICDARQFYTGRPDCYYCYDVGTGIAGRCNY
jgi:hypothetical protein